MEQKYSKEQKKIILTYSIELFVFSIIFIVLGILKLTDVIHYNDSRRIILNYITLVGSLWGFTDFIWTLKSPKRRAKNSLFDKILILPLSAFLFVFDLLCIFKPDLMVDFEKIGFNIAFFYIAVVYAAMAVYHWYHPVPMLLEETK